MKPAAWGFCCLFFIAGAALLAWYTLFPAAPSADVAGPGEPPWFEDVTDVVVSQFGGVKLLLNNGDGTFRDATAEAGLSNPAWGMSLALFDYDRDGWLDLVVVNYLDYDPTLPCKAANGLRDYCHPKNFPG